MKAAQPAADGAAPHLVDYVETSATTLWRQMKDTFGGEFEKVLARMPWPGKDVRLDATLRQEWRDGVVKLLDLQGPYGERIPCLVYL